MRIDHTYHAKINVILISLILSIAFGTQSYGQQLKDIKTLTFATIFQDHMVLQQECKINIWGKATPGAQVLIAGSWGKYASGVANVAGKWLIKLVTPKAGGPYEVTVSAAGSTVMLHDILIGEVWLASGQSNMDIPLKGWPPDNLIFNSRQEIQNAKYPSIRFMKVPFALAADPQDSTGGKWAPVSPETAGDFSATAYFFARKLQQKLNVPVGIIQSSIGGTPAEAWTSKEYLEKLGDFDSVINAQHNGAQLNSNSPTVLYNAMINPLVPFSMKGVIWYQGESNVGRASQYRRLFPLLIQDWRNEWADILPFYYVQIAPFLYTAADQKEQSQKLRDAQRYALSLPKTGMVTTLDIGYLKTAHPPYKQQVGDRLARFALSNNYGNKMVVSGPLFQKAILSGNKLIVKFHSTGSGLIAGASGLNNFEIAGVDRSYVKAQAEIIKNTVVVSSPLIAKPVYVRYAWSDGSDATLFNKEGLPAATFTSDGGDY
jgi:sialate O-acetylesterase